LPALWFGLLPAAAHRRRLIVYCTYYGIPVAMGIAYRADRLAEFEDGIRCRDLPGSGCYLAAPRFGPRVPPDRPRPCRRWPGQRGAVVPPTFEGNELDAFPSGHTALSLIFLACGWRLFPRWRAPLALLVAGILFSTVYLSLHYVVDVIAGALLACAMPFLLPLLRRLASPRPLSDRR
jgi:hypothetical protein